MFITCVCGFPKFNRDHLIPIVLYIKRTTTPIAIRTMKQRKAARKTGSSKRSTPRSASSRKAVRAAISLPEECGIASAAKLQATLLKRLGESASVRIDASAVQRVDSASLQLLAAFARDRRDAGRDIEWVGVPESFTDAASLLALTDALGLATQPGLAVPA